MTRQLHCKRDAFTLIELLVVISIIALLVAILLPALAAARETAMATQCQSRLRSFAMWTHYYAEDNEDWIIPQRAYGGSIDPALIWFNVILPYVDAPNDTTKGNSAAENYFLCPGQTLQTGTTAATADYRKYAYISDGWKVINYQSQGFFGYGNIPSQQPRWHPKKRGSIKIRPDLMLNTEVFGTSGQAVGYNNSTTTMITPHPGGSTQASFIDGHVENMGPYDQMVANRNVTWRFEVPYNNY